MLSEFEFRRAAPSVPNSTAQDISEQPIDCIFDIRFPLWRLLEVALSAAGIASGIPHAMAAACFCRQYSVHSPQ